MSITPAEPRRAPRLLLAIMLVGACIRFWDLPSQGILFYDEAVQALQSRSLAVGLAGDARMPSAQDEYQPAAGKHGHIALVAAAMRFVGPRDWAGGLVSAAFGTISIYLTYRLGVLACGEISGLLAATFLAFSGLHLAYSREGLAEADTLCFFLLAVVLLVERHRRLSLLSRDGSGYWWMTVLAGLSGGAAVLCHYRAGVYVAGLLLLQIATAISDRRQAPAARAAALALFVVSASLPLVACELLLSLAKRSGQLATAEGYFADIAFHYRHLARRSAAFAGEFVRPQFLRGYWEGFLRMEGPVQVALVPLGLIALLRRREVAPVWVAALVLGPWIFYGLRAGGGLRYLSLTLPFLAIAKAECARSACEWIAHRKSGFAWSRRWVIATVLGVALASLPWARPVMTLRSPYREVMNRIEETAAPSRLTSTAYFICKFYANSAEVVFPPDSEWELYTMYQDGLRYLVVDHERFSGGYFGAVGDSGLADLVKRVRESTTPRIEVANPLPNTPQYILEGTVEYPAYAQLRDEIARSTAFESVKAYDLADYFEAVPEADLRSRAIRDFEGRLARGGEISVSRLFIYLHSLGYLLWREGAIDRAMAVYEELLARYPGTLTGHLALGGLYEAKRDARSALLHYEEASRLAPESSEAKERAARMRVILDLEAGGAGR